MRGISVNKQFDENINTIINRKSVQSNGTALLYGDGINDDYPAIQSMLNSRTNKVMLPSPKQEYVISKTLMIYSNQQLVLDRFTVIKLMEDSNCLMIKNANPHNDSNICIEGGIWDMNHRNQLPNPFRFPSDELDNPIYYERPRKNEALYEIWDKNARESKFFLDVYCGMAMQFNGIKNFTLKGITIKNPVVYGVQAAYLEQFTIEDITFDYTEGSPKLWNMDGVHLEGGCKYGIIRNLKGSCHDDMVAITADDSLHGEIDSIVVEGIFADSASHSAVRLLSYKSPVRNIHISNVFGEFYTYCIGITKYSGTAQDRGVFENITVDNVYARGSYGTSDVIGGKYPFIFIEGKLNIKNLNIKDVFRDEKLYNKPLIFVGEHTTINRLNLNNVNQKSYFDAEIPFIENYGTIDKLILTDTDNNGKVLIKDKGNIKEVIKLIS